MYTQDQIIDVLWELGYTTAEIIWIIKLLKKTSD